MSLTQRLRHRIDIEGNTPAQDETTGEMVAGWSVVAEDVPAEFVPLSGREFLQSAATDSEVTARVTIRWMPAIEPHMRIVHDGSRYEIKAVLPDPTGRRHITLMVASDG